MTGDTAAPGKAIAPRQRGSWIGAGLLGSVHGLAFAGLALAEAGLILALALELSFAIFVYPLLLIPPTLPAVRRVVRGSHPRAVPAVSGTQPPCWYLAAVRAGQRATDHRARHLAGSALDDPGPAADLVAGRHPGHIRRLWPVRRADAGLLEPDRPGGRQQLVRVHPRHQLAHRAAERAAWTRFHCTRPVARAVFPALVRSGGPVDAGADQAGGAGAAGGAPLGDPRRGCGHRRRGDPPDRAGPARRGAGPAGRDGHDAERGRAGDR